MNFGMDNEHSVTKGNITLTWGTVGGNPMLAKNAPWFYQELFEVNNIARNISNISEYEPSTLGYVVLFGMQPNSQVYKEKIVLLIPEASFFTLDPAWLHEIGVDSWLSTKHLVENNQMAIFADVFVSYVPAKNSIVPTMWLAVDSLQSDAQFGVQNPYGIGLYNSLKEALPAVDLETESDKRYAVVEYFNEDVSINVVFNRNHSAFNGSAPRDIIMKPVLAVFAETDSAFFNGDVDEIAIPDGSAEPSGISDGDINLPTAGEVDKPSSFDEAMGVLSAK